MRPDVSELLKKLGIDMNVVATGTYKQFSTPFKPLTSDEKQKDKRWRQEEIELIQQSFLEEITENRRQGQFRGGAVGGTSACSMLYLL